MGYDPTSEHVDARLDPRTQRMEGVAHQGNTPFSVPYVSQITETLWVGGCSEGLQLPLEIEYVVSLYPWEKYTLHPGVKGVVSEKLYDSDFEKPDRVLALAKIVNEFRKLGPTLVHCQAGLNRSNLVAALALSLDGQTPEEAIALLREKRSPAVLCNADFEDWLVQESTAFAAV